MKFEEIIKKANVNKKTVIDLVENKKFKAFNDNPTWENFLAMHIYQTNFKDLKNSDVYDLLKDFKVSDAYWRDDILVVVINESATKIKKLSSMAKQTLIRHADIRNRKGGENFV